MWSVVDRSVVMRRMTVLDDKLTSERVTEIQSGLFRQVVQNLLDAACRLLKLRASNHFCYILYMVLSIGVCNLRVHPIC